jgi:polar amino acid transport system substrate-binding protein
MRALESAIIRYLAWLGLKSRAAVKGVPVASIQLQKPRRLWEHGELLFPGHVMRFARPLALILSLLCSARAGAEGAAPLRLAAEEWPPYVTASLPEGGMSTAFAAAVLARLALPLQVEYFPWKRTMELGLHDPRYAGFLAVWRTPERDRLCHFSTSVGNTMTVLAYLRDAPLVANTLADLKGQRIGTVAGYANGPEFDALVHAGSVATEEAVGDETNLRKLLLRRFPAVLIERRVLRHLLNSARFTRAERERIASLDTLFRERSVHVCFQRTPEGLARQRAFNDAAREIDLVRFERDYLRRIGEDPGSSGN